jgi:hypothetical protein
MMDNQQPVNLSLINCPVLCRQSSLIVGFLSSRAFGLQTVRRRCRQVKLNLEFVSSMEDTPEVGSRCSPNLLITCGAKLVVCL